MALFQITRHDAMSLEKRGHGRDAMSTSALILEAWGQGFTVGAFVMLMLIVLCNYRRHILLHKLILLEMLLALFHGTFIFLDDPTYGWYLSATATLLFISYQVHNFVAYLKIKSFVPRWGRWTYLVTLILVQPYWILEAYDNYLYFNLDSNLNVSTRPWEALARDPWWIFTTVALFYRIKTGYEFTFLNLFKVSPRFCVMVGCMILSIGFLLADVIVTAANMTRDTGINPYWRLTLVFKCASDTIFLDDFKSVLDNIVLKRFQRFRSDGDGHGTTSLTAQSRKKSQSAGVDDRSNSKPGFNVGFWKASKAEQRTSQPIEMSGKTYPKGDGDSSDAILETSLPVFPDATITFERKVTHEDWHDMATKNKTAYKCSVTASRDDER